LLQNLANKNIMIAQFLAITAFSSKSYNNIRDRNRQVSVAFSAKFAYAS